MAGNRRGATKSPPKDDGLQRFNVGLPQATADELKALSASTGNSIASIIRTATADYLKAQRA